MSKEQQLYNQALVNHRGNPLGAQVIENGRSLHRVFTLLGMSAAAAAAWFGAFYIYQHYYNEEQGNSEGSVSAVKLGDLVNGNSVEVAYASEEKLKKITLFQCPRGYFTPCVAPFPFKLETFLRVANIPYEVDFSYQPANLASPWMTLDGVDVLESHDCIPLISSTFGVDLEKPATQQSRLTASRLVGIMLENHIYWGIALWRWVFDEGKSLKHIQPLSPSGEHIVTEVSASVVRAAWYHGLGRLTKEQLIDVILVDLADLAAALGNHDFFLGKQPGEVDCSAFAMLAQMLWNMPGSPFEKGIKKHNNLVKFVIRMRERYWPDWDELLQKHADSELPNDLLYPTGEFRITLAEISKSKNRLVDSKSYPRGKQEIEYPQERSTESSKSRQSYSKQSEQLYEAEDYYGQDQGYPMGTNGTVVNQDERLLLQQQEQLFRQQIDELNGLKNPGTRFPQMRGYIDPLTAQQQQFGHPNPQQYYQDSSHYPYDSRDMEDPNSADSFESQQEYVQNNPYNPGQNYVYPLIC